MHLFQKLNLAQCARLRAEDHVLESGPRFANEHATAHMWMRHDCCALIHEGTVLNYKW
jgi:hypothetical protein